MPQLVNERGQALTGTCLVHERFSWIGLRLNPGLYRKQNSPYCRPLCQKKHIKFSNNA
jgi:hypothetical protein